MPLDHLWATWRSAYVGRIVDTRTLATEGEAEPDGRTLFERILAGGDADGDEAAGILHRGPTCFALLNRYPYTSGHLMVLPQRGVAELEDLTAEEHDELWATVRDAVVALKAALRCDAVNVGLNLGPAAGGSQSEHLHAHCVPRWLGDANFLSTAAETRTLPISLDEVGASLRAAWPR